MTVPYDKRIAYDATAISQCMTMGAVVLKPKAKPSAGFAPPPSPPPEPREPASP